MIPSTPSSTLLTTLAMLLAGAIGASAPALAQWNDGGGSAERRLTCASNPNGENFCPLNNAGPVRLVRSFGPSACVEGGTWRTDGRGVYVRNGCRGSIPGGAISAQDVERIALSFYSPGIAKIIGGDHRLLSHVRWAG